MSNSKTLKVTLIRSKFGRKPGHKQCIEGLGLRRMHHSVEVQATDCNLGMINKVRYLLKVENVLEPTD